MLARQIAIGFGIALVFPLLVFYGVCTFHPAPKLSMDGTTECMMLAVTPEQRVECTRQQRAALDAHAAANKEFSWRYITIATPLGISAILIGVYLPNYAIGTGLILGGIMTLTFGYWSYWEYIDSWARFLSLLLGFAMLLFVGYKGAERIERSDRRTRS